MNFVKSAPLQIAMIGLVLLLTLSVLGGSAVWFFIGVSDDLNIDGHATVIQPAPPGLGVGWPSYGGDSGGNRHSAAAAITPDNVQQLAIAWTYRTGTLKDRQQLKERTAFEATPILTADSLVFCTPFNEVIALDPGSGRKNGALMPKSPPIVSQLMNSFAVASRTGRAQKVIWKKLALPEYLWEP